MNTYKSHLNRDVIKPLIEEYVGRNATISETTNGSRTTYSIRFNDPKIKTALLLVYENIDGTTTLSPNSGKNREYSTNLADYIFDKSKIDLYDVSHVYFKNISNENLSTLNSSFTSYGYTISEAKEIANGKKYDVTSSTGDVLHYIHYNNSAILFQGRPSLLFNQTIDLLYNVFPTNDVIKQVLGYYKIEIPCEEFKEELSTTYNNLYTSLDEKQLAILLPSIALRRVLIDGLSDYSYITYPVLKTTEGVIKSIFNKYGIIIDNNGFEGYFSYNHTRKKWETGEKTDKVITDTTVKNKLINLYTLYHNHRHSLFHYDILTPIIKTKEEALDILDEALEVLNTNC